MLLLPLRLWWQLLNLVLFLAAYGLFGCFRMLCRGEYLENALLSLNGNCARVRFVVKMNYSLFRHTSAAMLPKASLLMVIVRVGYRCRISGSKQRQHAINRAKQGK